MTIENPEFTVNYEMPFSETITYIKAVINALPRSYKVLGETSNSIDILILEQYKDFQNMTTTDMILKANNTEESVVKYEVTNQRGVLDSHMEAERDKYALQIFMKLLDQSLRGTLANNIKAAGQPKVDPAKAVMQLIMLVVAILAILFGLQGLFR